MSALYDTIGHGYNAFRQPDPRFVKALLKRFPENQSQACLLEIGAGTGNYTQEILSHGYQVHALEPSVVMQQQCQSYETIQWITDTVETWRPERAYDVIYAVMSLHHVASLSQTLDKLAVNLTENGRFIIATIDLRLSEAHWFADYFPEVWDSAFDIFPPVQSYGKGSIVTPFLIPDDFCDQFAPSAWMHPERYLDEQYRLATSGFSRLDKNVIESRVETLSNDLNSGAWDKRYGHLRQRTEFDIGMRIIQIQPGV